VSARITQIRSSGLPRSAAATGRMSAPGEVVMEDGEITGEHGVGRYVRDV
jgi:hypothetical protein